MKLETATHLRRTGELAGGIEVEAAGRRLRITNLHKTMYPIAGLTKGEVIDYYARVADAMLPHVAGRPLTLKRFPDGLGGAYFFEKQCPRHRPDWVTTVPIWVDAYATHYDYCVVSEPATLVWLANLASLEVHPALARAGDLSRPTVLAFDIDPGYPAGPVEACQVALWLRGLLEVLGLTPFVKSSGSKGLHVLVPIEDRATHAATKGFARQVAETLAERFPALALANIARARRSGKVLIDWAQNDRHKTIVAPYSLRATDPPTVSVPLRWAEVERTLDTGDPDPLVLDPPAMLRRLAREGDLWEEMPRLGQRLPAAAPGEGAAA
jgi:bifunctional non-homologous end joining protein LigD